jgi:DNA-binding GntR family transcriptional regulator
MERGVAMSVTAKVPVSGREKAYEFLRRTVLTDPEMEGEFVSEQEVAEHVGVSRTPVREALLRLAAEELVQLVPNRGAYIAPLSGRDLRDLFELRGVLERFAAQKVLSSGTIPIDDLREAICQQERCEGPAEDRHFISFDHYFHSLLIDAAGNPMVSKTYAGLRARQVRAGLVALSRADDRKSQVLVEHDAIVNALAAGDLEATLAAIDRHHTATLSLQLTTT